MRAGWWTHPIPLTFILLFGFSTVWIVSYALFGVIPAFALAAIFVFLLARGAARHLRE
jgi:hypothetical protein